MRREKWDIWNAFFKFEDNTDDGKVRPVLVLGSDEYFTISAEITKHEPREEFEGEVAIKYWQEAGLKFPSTVRLTKVLELSDFSFSNKVGKLKFLDRKIIEEEMNKINFSEQM